MRFKKVLLGVFILAVILFLAALFGVNYAEKHYSNRVIPVKDKVAISIGGIDLSLLKGGVVLRDIQLLDTLDPIATGSVENVTVQGIHLWKLITGGGVSISALNVEGVNCALYLNRLKQDTSTISALDSLDAVIAKDSFGVAEALDSLNALDKADTVQAMLYLWASKLSLGFDKDMQPDFHVLDIDRIQFRPGKGKYDVDVGSIISTNGLELIEIDSFQLIPRYPKYEFGFQAGRRMASIDILIEKIDVLEFDIKALTQDSTIDIRSIVCHRAVAHLFSDKRVPIDMERYGALPQEALLNASRLITIDSVLIKDADVRFASLNPSTMEEGFLEFKKSYVSLYNITNVPERIEQNGSMILDIHSKFTNEGELDAHFDFLLNRKDYRFIWHGSLGRMKLGNVDSFVLPIASMNITDGYCHSLKFQVVSDADSSRGSLRFQYTNLKVMAMDPDRKKERRFLSGIANTLVVKSNNLVGDKHFVEGPILFGREKNRGLPDYVWKSLEHGILFTILPEGIANTVEKQTAKTKANEDVKSEKADKKNARKQKRQEKKQKG